MPGLPLAKLNYLSWLFLQLAMAGCPQLLDFNSKSTDSNQRPRLSTLIQLLLSKQFFLD